MKMDSLIRCIDSNVQCVMNPASAVSKSYGNLAPTTVHHVSALINDKKTLVSSYVSRSLFDKISYYKLQEICQVTGTAGNPVLNGIIFELLFLFKIKAICDVQSKKDNLQLYGNDGKVEQWTVTSWRWFDPTDIGKRLNQDWLISQKWNQALFDCIQLKPKTLRIVQVTRAKTHGYRLDLLLELISQFKAEKCKVKFIDFVMLYSKDDPSISRKDSGRVNFSVKDFNTKKPWTEKCIRFLSISL